MSNWANKRVLITGASRGVGLAVAQKFARSGSRVAFNFYRGDARGPLEIRRLRAEGLAVLEAPGDPLDNCSASEMIARAIRDMGGLDLFVSNADAPNAPRRGAQLEWRPAEDRVTSNLVAAYRCVMLASAALRSARGLAILAASLGKPGIQSTTRKYEAGRYDLTTITGKLARALAPDVRVNGVGAGYCAPDNVADAIWYFGNSQTGTSGQTVTVDNGIAFVPSANTELHLL